MARRTRKQIEADDALDLAIESFEKAFDAEGTELDILETRCQAVTEAYEAAKEARVGDETPPRPVRELPESYITMMEAMNEDAKEEDAEVAEEENTDKGSETEEAGDKEPTPEGTSTTAEEEAVEAVADVEEVKEEEPTPEGTSVTFNASYIAPPHLVDRKVVELEEANVPFERRGPRQVLYVA